MSKPAGKEKTTYKDPLVGLFFHTKRANSVVGQQGYVTDSLGGGYYLARLYSWVSGEPIGLRTFGLGETGEWSFYDDEEMWREPNHAP